MNPKIKIGAAIALIIVTLSLAFCFVNTHIFIFRSPILLQSPLTIKKRILQVVTVQNVVADNNQNPLTPDQQFACNLFGKDCLTALAIMRAESHDRPNAINFNKNGTADLGCWQINTIHLAQIDTTNLNILNCQDNTRAAYEIYKQQKGFSAWVTYSSGEYKKYLIH